MPNLSISVAQREEIVDLTDDMHELAAQRGWTDGALFLFCASPSSGLTMGSPDFQTLGIAVASLVLPVFRGSVQIGPEERVLFCERAGPGSRAVQVFFSPGQV